MGWLPGKSEPNKYINGFMHKICESCGLAAIKLRVFWIKPSIWHCMTVITITFQLTLRFPHQHIWLWFHHSISLRFNEVSQGKADHVADDWTTTSPANKMCDNSNYIYFVTYNCACCNGLYICANDWYSQIYLSISQQAAHKLNNILLKCAICHWRAHAIASNAIHPRLERTNHM